MSSIEPRRGRPVRSIRKNLRIARWSANDGMRLFEDVLPFGPGGGTVPNGDERLVEVTYPIRSATKTATEESRMAEDILDAG